MFLLCVNPFIDLFQRLSDSQACSMTRVRADDFGSAIKALSALRTHASIFRLASKVAGLHLKPTKCVIVLTCISLSEDIVLAVKAWLTQEVPDFANFILSDCGKYLGWILGHKADLNSWSSPIQKFKNRICEIVGGKAPATASICRYNSRALTVLSYVAQFTPPPAEHKVPGLAHWGIHSILRIPPNSLSRQLCYSMGVCSIVQPVPIEAYCNAIIYRFASSERDYLYALQSKVQSIFGSDASLLEASSRGLPNGGLNSTSILRIFLMC